MNWVLEHIGEILFTIGFILALVSYFFGREVGYTEGLEDGFKDGQLND